MAIEVVFSPEWFVISTVGTSTPVAFKMVSQMPFELGDGLEDHKRLLRATVRPRTDRVFDELLRHLCEVLVLMTSNIRLRIIC